MGLLSKVSKWHVTLPPEECVLCRLCEEMCPYGAIREPTVAQAADERRRGSRRLAVLIVLLPVLVAMGVGLGRGMKAALSQLHPTVRLAERIRLEERMERDVQTRLAERGSDKPAAERGRLEEQIRQEVLKDNGQVEGTTDASEAFRKSGRPLQELFDQQRRQTDRFGVAGGWLGAWVGLVIGVKLIHLSVRRRREDYLPDRTNCVSCGRCFWYCPGEQARLGLISDVATENRTP